VNFSVRSFYLQEIKSRYTRDHANQKNLYQHLRTNRWKNGNCYHLDWDDQDLNLIPRYRRIWTLFEDLQLSFYILSDRRSWTLYNHRS
jgi:hypothetical protein